MFVTFTHLWKCGIIIVVSSESIHIHFHTDGAASWAIWGSESSVLKDTSIQKCSTIIDPTIRTTCTTSWATNDNRTLKKDAAVFRGKMSRVLKLYQYLKKVIFGREYLI